MAKKTLLEKAKDLLCEANQLEKIARNKDRLRREATGRTYPYFQEDMANVRKKRSQAKQFKSRHATLEKKKKAAKK